MPANPDMADVPGDPDDPQPVIVAEWEVEPLTEEVSALDTLVDLAVEQPRRDMAQSALGLLGPITAGVGVVLPPQPMPPCPWLRMTLGHPGDAAGMHLVAPLHHPTPSVVAPADQVTVSTSAPMKVVLRPPEVQEGEVAIAVGVDHGAVGGTGAPGPTAAAAHSPKWAERVEEQEEELRAMSTCSKGDEGSQDQALAPPRPTPDVRPALQARDAILAVKSLALLADAQLLVPTLMSQFSTNLSPLNWLTEWNGCG